MNLVFKKIAFYGIHITALYVILNCKLSTATTTGINRIMYAQTPWQAWTWADKIKVCWFIMMVAICHSGLCAQSNNQYMFQRGRKAWFNMVSCSSSGQHADTQNGGEAHRGCRGDKCLLQSATQPQLAPQKVFQMSSERSKDVLP